MKNTDTSVSFHIKPEYIRKIKAIKNNRACKAYLSPLLVAIITAPKPEKELRYCLREIQKARDFIA